MLRKSAGLIVFVVLLGFQASSTAPVQLKAVNQPPGQYTALIRDIECFCALGAAGFGKPCVEAYIRGTGFGDKRVIHSGNTKRTRVVVVDGQAIASPGEYYYWGDTSLTCDIDDFEWVVVNHMCKIAIGEIIQPLNDPKNQTLVMISPVFNFRILIKWKTDSPPQSGHHGDVIQEVACGVRPPQGDMVLMMGSTQVSNIISWGNPWGHVIFQVPNIPPGAYNLHIKKGAEVVSTYKAFTVK